MAAYTAGPTGSGDTHIPQVMSGGKKRAVKKTAKKAVKAVQKTGVKGTSKNVSGTVAKKVANQQQQMMTPRQRARAAAMKSASPNS